VQAGASSIFGINHPVSSFSLVLVVYPVVLLDLVIVGEPFAAYHAGMQCPLVAIPHYSNIWSGARIPHKHLGRNIR
jgi:hypothetical protein